MSPDPRDEHPEDEPGAEELQPALQETVDAASPEAVKKQTRRLKKEEREAEEFWQEVFSTEIGRREMWKLLNDLHPFNTEFAIGPGGFPNEASTWFKHGQQQWGLNIFRAWLLKAPELVLLMLREHDPRFTAKGKRSR